MQRRHFIKNAGVAGLAAAGSFAQSPMPIPPQLTPVTIFASNAFFAAGSLFPQMQRLTLAGTANANPAAAWRSQMPYRLWGMQMAWSLKTTTDVIGFQVILGHDEEQLAYSAAVNSLGGASFLGTTIVSSSEYIEFPPNGVLIPPDKSIALYGYTSAPMLVTDVLGAFVNLFLTQES